MLLLFCISLKKNYIYKCISNPESQNDQLE